MSRLEFDVAIVGAGLVGAALAGAVRGLSVAVLGKPVQFEADAAALDPRVYAISPGNAAFLRTLGAWQAIPPERLAPVHAMRVFGDDGTSCIEFDAYRAGVPELAWIVEDRVLQQALWRSLAGHGGIAHLSAEIEHIDFGAQGATLARRGEPPIGARLVVGADGARSFVRAQAGIAAREHPYGQAALVANFACGRPHRGTAYQWFQGGPVLALLPLPGNRVSAVWSLPDGEAARIEALPQAELCREVEAAARGMLGELSLITPPKCYPLQRLAAQRMCAPRVALAGDAAHVIHPLAGQGANLGLQDARVLAEVLAAREPGRDPGDARLLRRYERARAEPILAMATVVDALQRLFGAPRAAWLRNTGLNLTDRLPVLKNLLVRQAMT